MFLYIFMKNLFKKIYDVKLLLALLVCGIWSLILMQVISTKSYASTPNTSSMMSSDEQVSYETVWVGNTKYIVFHSYHPIYVIRVSN